MLTGVFYWILNMSIIGSLSGLIILALRKIRGLPRFPVYLLWPVVLIRMVIPFGITNQFSLVGQIAKFTTVTVPVRIFVPFPEISMSNFVMGANEYFPMVYKSKNLENIFAVSSIIWIIFAIAGMISAALLYYFTKSEIRNARHLNGNIYESANVTTPTVYGIFNPKIILPADIADNKIDYILAHEQIHIKRKDNLIRIAAISVACIHWFNPLVWIFLRYFLVDMELTCDSKVLKKLSENEKNEYAHALLDYSSGRQTFMASAFSSSKIRVRIENVLSYKKLTITSCIFFALLFSAIIFVLLTNAKI
ncbi:MAG: M56 family metallopeptidase [Saccharofermentanales bacterium]